MSLQARQQIQTNLDKFNQKDTIIQFTVACFTALCTIKFLQCRASYKWLLPLVQMIDTLLLRRVRSCNTILLCDWFEGSLIPRKAKDRNVTRLDCWVQTRLWDTKGHFSVILKKTWISKLYFTIFAKKCLVRCVRTCSQILNNSPVCTVFA